MEPRPDRIGTPSARPAPSDGSGRRRRPLLLWPVGLALLGGAVYGGWEIYRLLEAPPAPTEAPLFAADPSPYKLPPDDPGGDDIPNTDVAVLEDTISGETGVEFEQLMPAPEEPLALDPETDAAPGEDGIIDVEAAEAAEVVRDVDSGPIFSAEEVSAYMDEIMAEAGGGTLSGAPLPEAKPEPPTASAGTAGLSEDAAVIVPALDDDGADLSFDDVAAAVSGGSSGTEGDGSSPSGDGLARVQIAAYSTRDAATAAWNRLHANHNDLLGDVEAPRILETVLGEATVYRLQVGAYRKRADAEALCADLKRRDIDCFAIGP